MRIWVTRPEPDATPLKQRLIAQGHDVVIEPLMWIDHSGAEIIELDGAQALVATSRNGIRALGQQPEALEIARTLPVFVVGPGTAVTAKEFGFEQIVKGGGRASDLVSAILAHAEVNGGPLVYLAGETVSHDIAADLRRFGFAVLQPAVYAARMTDRLTTAFLPQLVLGEVDAVILLSAQTAQTYVRLVEQHQLVRSARKLHHYCISKTVAEALAPLQPDVIKVPDRPNIHEILALTDETTTQSD